MSRATVARVCCAICGYSDAGVVMAAQSGEDQEHPQLFQACLPCLNEMFNVAKLLEMRLREKPNVRWRADYGPDWTRIHNAILERDDRQCQDAEHMAVGGAELRESLVVHHIKPLKQFDGDYIAGNQPENPITLCTICHGRWHGALTRAKNRELRERV